MPNGTQHVTPHHPWVLITIGQWVVCSLCHTYIRAEVQQAAGSPSLLSLAPSASGIICLVDLRPKVSSTYIPLSFIPLSLIYKRPKTLGPLCCATLETRDLRATLTESNRHQRIVYTGFSNLGSFYTSVTMTEHPASQKH